MALCNVFDGILPMSFQSIRQTENLSDIQRETQNYKQANDIWFLYQVYLRTDFNRLQNVGEILGNSH